MRNGQRHIKTVLEQIQIFRVVELHTRIGLYKLTADN